MAKTFSLIKKTNNFLNKPKVKSLLKMGDAASDEVYAINLRNWLNTQYSGELMIGSTKQKF